MGGRACVPCALYLFALLRSRGPDVERLTEDIAERVK
jgi:hypothetical protein